MKLIHNYTQDGYEKLVVKDDANGKIIAEISTSSDSPEDNNLSRMGATEFVEKIIEYITDVKPEIETVEVE